MTPSPSEEALSKIARSSRWAAFGSAAGAVIVLLSLLFASTRLSRLQQEEKRLLAETAKLRHERIQLLEEASRSASQGEALKKSVANLQCALASSRAAINAFHAREYGVAIELYDEALRCDPQNAYLLDLKAYSQFKAGAVDAAIETARASVSADGNYAWGYFDLARFLCATSRGAEAEDAARRAIALRPDLRLIMRADGEFRRLCGGRARFFDDIAAGR